MSTKFTPHNVITHLHREPGLDLDTDPELFEYAYEVRNVLKSHFALEGLDLLIDLQLGAMCLQVMDDEKIARVSRDTGGTPFRPIYSSRAQNYWASVLLVILRLRYESAIATPEAAWVFENDLFAEFLRYHDAEHRENHGKVRDGMTARLRDLEGKGFVMKRISADRGTSWCVTKWVVLRLTDDVLLKFIEDLTYVAESEGGKKPAKEEAELDEDDLVHDLFNAAQDEAIEPAPADGDMMGKFVDNADGAGEKA